MTYLLLLLIGHSLVLYICELYSERDYLLADNIFRLLVRIPLILITTNTFFLVAYYSYNYVYSQIPDKLISSAAMFGSCVFVLIFLIPLVIFIELIIGTTLAHGAKYLYDRPTCWLSRKIIVRKQNLYQQDKFGKLYRLYEIPFMSYRFSTNYLVIVEVYDATSGKKYFLSVPPNIHTAKEGISWSFDVPVAEYAPLVET